MERRKQSFIVLGTGVSGAAAAELLQAEGAAFCLYDANTKMDTEAFFRQHPQLAEARLYLGEIPEEVRKTVDTAVLSPGVPADSPLVEELRARGVKIWGEIELAYRFSKGRIAAITGTNGKTTTTSLVGEIMKLCYDSVKVVGNIGIPYTKMARETRDDTVVVAEISSFQLETVERFAPEVSAILNITPDHLDRHHTMENYIAAKERIAMNQKGSDVCVLNYEDEELRRFGESLPIRTVFFSAKRRLRDGLYYEDGILYRAKDGEAEEILPVEQMQILGVHNYENAMAAAAVCESMGVPLDLIRQGLKAFRAVEHRIEFVCRKKGVAFYNDSKGTNPDAAIKGIKAMPGATVLIGGGYDKHADYGEWIESFHGKVKRLLLLGQTKEAIAACCREHGFFDYTFTDTLEEAVRLAYELAEPGESVLLSPACASWGMFENYEQRGRIYKECVGRLEE